jgi:hypothetical protein
MCSIALVIKLKKSHDFVMDISRSIIELVILVIYLGYKFEHIIKVFAVHPVSFLSQTLKEYFVEIRGIVMWSFTYCNLIGVILP